MAEHISLSEIFVRSFWKRVEPRWKDNDSYADNLFLLSLGTKYFGNKDALVVWIEAEKYTMEYLKNIELVEEQLNWLKSFTSKSVHNTIQEQARDYLITNTKQRLDILKIDLK
jgi:hypothetical protein